MFVIGLSAAGHVCWETPLDRTVAYDHTSSVPLINDGAAYLDSDTSVFAVDVHDGRLRWRWDSGSPQATGARYGGGGNRTLAVADGRVVATRGANLHQDVVGLDEASGALRWSFPEPPHSDPQPTGDGGLAFSSDSGTVSEVIDDRNGATRWSRPTPPPIVAGGLVEVSAPATPVGIDLVEPAPGGGIQALRAVDGSVAWTRPGQVEQIVYTGGLLLVTPSPGKGVGHYNVDTTAVDPNTGRNLWAVGPLDPGGSRFLDLGGDLLHAQSGPQGGTYARLDPATGGVLWQIPTHVQAAAAADGLLIDVETSGDQYGNEAIVARDPATGAVRWRTPPPPAQANDNFVNDDLFTVSGPGGTALIEVHAGHLSGFDPATGARRWDLVLPDLAVIDRYVATTGGVVIQVAD